MFADFQNDYDRHLNMLRTRFLKKYHINRSQLGGVNFPPNFLHKEHSRELAFKIIRFACTCSLHLVK